ncbi:MAG: hypothetical protein ISQ76_00135, partial [Opitutales bacterium]|nr:hypothetical protein [Opitutales bacterium]
MKIVILKSNLNSQIRGFFLLFGISTLLPGCFSSSKVYIPESIPPDAYARQSSTSNKKAAIEPLSQKEILKPIESLQRPKDSFLSYRKSHSSQPPSLTKSKSENADYTFKVKSIEELWIWVQDPKGNDIVWKKMVEGDELLITERAPLTLTCSKPNAVIIYDKKGKKVDYPKSINSGTNINIIRLN